MNAIPWKRKGLSCIERNEENWEWKEYESVVTEHDNKETGENKPKT